MMELILLGREDQVLSPLVVCYGMVSPLDECVQQPLEVPQPYEK
jgi:hypothetical protein